MDFQGKTIVISGDGLLGKALKLETKFNDNYIFSSRRNTSDLHIDVHNLRDFNFLGANSIIYNLQSSYYKSHNLDEHDLNFVNFEFPKKLSTYCYKNSIHFTYLSTGSVYKSSEGKLNENCELISTRCASPYVISKLKAEEYISQNSNALILRPFFLVGRDAPDSSLLKTLIRKISQNEIIFLQGEEGVTFTFTPVKFAAKAILELVKDKNTGIFNLASDLNFSIFELSNKIAKILKKDLFVEIIDKSQNITADTEKLKKSIPNITYPSYKEMDRLLKHLCKIELPKS